MKRKGSVTVLSLIVMAVILISSLYLIYISKLQTIISSSYNNSIQSNYLAESKLNILLYNDKYFIEELLPAIIKYVKTPTSDSNDRAYIHIEAGDLDVTDENSSIGIDFFVNHEKKHMMGISSKSTYKGIESEIIAYGTLVNDLYHYGASKVISKVNNDDIVEIIDEISKNITMDKNKLPTTLNGIQFSDRKLVNIDYNNGSYYSLKYGETTLELKNDLFLIMKDELYTQDPIKLHIGGIKSTEKMLKFKGLIYLEGDLVISNDFQFNGILILKGGKIIIDNDTKPIFKGIILTDSDIDYSGSIAMDSDYQGMCMFGVYLPDFIDPKIEVIKKY